MTIEFTFKAVGHGPDRESALEDVRQALAEGLDPVEEQVLEQEEDEEEGE